MVTGPPSTVPYHRTKTHQNFFEKSDFGPVWSGRPDHLVRVDWTYRTTVVRSTGPLFTCLVRSTGPLGTVTGPLGTVPYQWSGLVRYRT